MGFRISMHFHTEYDLSGSLIPKDMKFPDLISSTAVELLMKRQYTFYAKKMLKLKKLYRFKFGPDLADFDFYIHYPLDQYSKSYSSEEK